MDDLIVYLIALFRNDPIILRYFQNAGQPTVLARYPKQRVNAAYPEILVYSVNEGTQTPYGENNRAKFFRGSVKIEITGKQSEADPDPLNTIDIIKKRVLYLIAGDAEANPPLQGIQGSQISSQFRVDSFYQITPTGYVDDGDITLERWLGTYMALLNQNGTPTFP